MKGQPYDYPVDIWSLGVILYEMVHGYSVSRKSSGLKGPNPNLQDGDDISFKKNVSLELVSLLKGMLTIRQEIRITLPEVFQHPWVVRKSQENNTNIQELLDLNQGLLTQEHSYSMSRSQGRPGSYFPEEFIEKADHGRRGRLTEGTNKPANSSTKDSFTHKVQVNHHMQKQ